MALSPQKIKKNIVHLFLLVGHASPSIVGSFCHPTNTILQLKEPGLGVRQRMYALIE